MSYRKIPNRFLNTLVNVYRESTAIDSVGDFDVTESVPYAAVLANVQPKFSDLEFMLQGKVHRQTHLCYINKYDPTEKEIKTGDFLLDTEAGLKHLVIGVQHFQTPREEISNSGHYRLSIEHIGDARYQYTRTKTITAKGYIST